jgi:hypothetical protein
MFKYKTSAHCQNNADCLFLVGYIENTEVSELRLVLQPLKLRRVEC